jgi:dTDP-3-amino-3,4,6-trideoxy-alpha-D-glucose transaminase
MTNSALSEVLLPVKLNDFQRMWAETGPDVLEAVRVTGESGWYILGSELKEFEKEFAAYWQRRYSVGVGNGLDAIEIGLRVCGCKPGDKVLVPPVSAFATVLAVVRIGAIPVFIDCDRFGLMDLKQAAAALAADRSIRYAVPVHIYGNCLDLEELRRWRTELQVSVIEDCAQSVGATWRGELCGSAGDCAATSFYPTKNLGAFGDGGALLTDSEEHASLARSLRDYGQTDKYVHQHIGCNSRLDEIHAAILRRAMLPRLTGWTEARRAVAQRYLDGIRNPRLEVVGSPEGSNSCWHLFPVLAPAGLKTEFMAHLRAEAVGAAEHYPIAMMDQPAMSQVTYSEFQPCTRGRDFCAREVSLPIHPYLSAGEIQRVIDVCNSWDPKTK